VFPTNPSDWRPVDPPPSDTASPPATRKGVGAGHAAMAVTMLLVALFGGLIGVAADRWISAHPNLSLAPIAAAPSNPNVPSVAPTVGPESRVGARSRRQNGGGATATGTPATSSAPAPAATPVATSAPATDPQQQAIQQVIQKADQEQQQALASNDPTVMSDTATSDFYQQQVQTNQDLKANGVTAIKLVNIDWGSVSITSGTATATAWETWTTTYSDGTTEQSRDRNVYTLVQDNGTWKVSADAHPDTPAASNPTGAGPAPGSASPGSRTQPGQSVQPSLPSQPSQPVQPSQPSRPRGGQGNNTSRNWSGYAATAGTLSGVGGTWNVPQFAPNSPAGVDATWVGIGGVNSRDLIQAGTQQSVSGSGSTQYEAWVETLPQASHPVSLTIHPGDSVSVSISQQAQGQDQWLVDFKNNTTGQTLQVTEHYTSSMSSAEWIEEAPSAGRGQVPLDNFGSVNFSAGSAVKDGQSVTLSGAGAHPITMIGRGGQPLATPSALSADGAGFTISHN
jgi:Peptidase A4 family